LFLTKPARAAALGAAVTGILSVAPAATAEDAASARPEHPLDSGRVDVAAISLAEGAIRLGGEDGTGQPQDPESLIYTTTQSAEGTEVGWDTSAIDAGEVFGDAVRMRLSAAEGPAEFRAEPLRLPIGDQGTTTWTFPAPGRYTLTFSIEANLLTGEPVNTEERYTVMVAPAPAEAPYPPPPYPPPLTPSGPAAAPQALRVAPAAQQAPATPGRIVLAEGHVDAVAPRLLDGKLQIQVKDGATVGQAGGRAHWREPRDVVFHVKPQSRTALPADPALAFLGKAGDEIFLLPQQQQAGILWTGWSTEELRADQVTGPVTWRLTKVDGPGAFGIFTTGSFGDSTVIFNSADGLPDSHPVALGTHAHANWGFAKQGVYRLTVDTTAKLTNGQTITDTETYTFAVGDIDPNSATLGSAGNGDDASGPGDSSARDTRAGNGNRDPRLADTGVDGVLHMTIAGVVLLGLGGAVVAAGRRRKPESR
jgi:surface-anchored protein/LPXTG-motif cell wall-anchored protein